MKRPVFSLTIGGALKPRIATDLNRDQVDLAGEQVVQTVQQAEPGIGPVTQLQGLEFDEEIQVARLRIKLPVHGRAKQLQPAAMMTATQVAQFRPVFFDQVQHGDLSAQSYRVLPPVASVMAERLAQGSVLTDVAPCETAPRFDGQGSA
jgi:hypothetical protein